MTELKEVFEMVTKQTEPDLDAWKEQELRQSRTARTRKLLALAAAAAIGIAAVVVAVQALDGRDTRPVVTPPPTLTPTPDTRRDLYVVDPETGDATLLLAARGDQTDPERSRDGARVVYVSTAPGGLPQIFVLEADGTERQLTALQGGAKDPTWSPDGRQIAFAGRGSDADIFVMNADGSRIRRLAGTPRHDGHPDWSPDGARIVFQSGPMSFCCDRWDIWVASVPEGTRTRLPLKYLPYGADPAWSPDGHWIAISVASGGLSNGEVPFAFLRLVRPDGTQAHSLGHGAPYGHRRRDPSWSPNGRSIVFEDKHKMCIIDVETGEDSVRCLGTGAPRSPSWGTEGILVSKLG